MEEKTQRKFSPGDKVVVKKGALEPVFKKLETTVGVVQGCSRFEDKVVVMFPDLGHADMWVLNESDLQFRYEALEDKGTRVTWLEPKIFAEVLNEMALVCRAEADKWYKDPATGELLPPLNVGERFMLMVSELAEGFEGVRKDLMDDHLPHRKMVEVELADAIIRILDFAGDQNMDLGGALIEKLAYNHNRQDHTNEARLAPGGKKF